MDSSFLSKKSSIFTINYFNSLLIKNLLVIFILTNYYFELCESESLCHTDCNCPTQYYYDCSSKFIKVFPSDFPSRITNLNLSNNEIENIEPLQISRLLHLESIDLSRNKLEMMDSLRFQELHKLQVLTLRRNLITNLSDAAFYGLKSLHTLNLDWNYLRVVDKKWLYGLENLKNLNLTHNQLQRFEEGSWEFSENLETLDMSFNQIKEISKRTFFGLKKLRTLSLSNNLITDMHEESFLSLGRLENLDLSFNQLSWVVEDVNAPFRGLKGCLSLNLASNKISTLHDGALKGLDSLRFLNLSSNPINWLSEKAFLLVPNVNLELNDVYSLVCDCEAQWLHSKLLHSIGRYDDTSRIKGLEKSISKTFCSFPFELKERNLLELPLHVLKCSVKIKRPIFIEQPKTQVFLVDGNGTLTCHIESPPNIPSSVKWKKNHQELSKELVAQVTDLEKVENDGSIHVISKLNLVNVSWLDSGSYQCIGQGYGRNYSQKANITVHIFPTFIKKPSNVTVRLGSNAKLECGARGFPPPEIAFQKDGGEDFPAALERRFHVMPNDDSFFIMEVKLSDMGIYSCSAKNTAGQVRSFATVTVYETPSFMVPLEDESAIEGSNAVIGCSATGSPVPQIIWMRNGVEIESEVGEGRRMRVAGNGSLLIIKDVQLEDAGRYECLLTNAIGTARGFSSLTVLSRSTGKLSLDNTTLTIIFIIIAVFCVVGTSAAWVVVIYSTRKRKRGGSNIVEGAPLRHTYDEYDRPSSNTNYPPFPPFQITKVICADSGSQSSSGKDSGNGDELHELMPTASSEAEEDVKRKSRREMESFSTFGGTRAGSSIRLSQARLDLKSESDHGNMISLTHTGKEFLSIPRRIPIPVPPPHLCSHTLISSTSPTNTCKRGAHSRTISLSSTASTPPPIRKEIEKFTNDNNVVKGPLISPTSFSTPV